MEYQNTMYDLMLRPVGVVKSQIKEPILFSRRKGLEMQGQVKDFLRRSRQIEQKSSKVIIDPARMELLSGIEAYSHLIVIYWGHKTPAGGRALDRIHPMGRKDLPLTGVFATYSPARPNPLLTTIVKLLECHENVLAVTGLDAIDRSPVLDIKPYVKEVFNRDQVRIPTWMQTLMDEFKSI